uniref:Uncharacterized protein n=1 Tax=Physcomitrium patens TaxID=3218 RepID=A0A2K1K092_PHYPA|nr:hypothetical protein PHYPA_014315 [Physcomitrium patens]
MASSTRLVYSAITRSLHNTIRAAEASERGLIGACDRINRTTESACRSPSNPFESFRCFG